MQIFGLVGLLVTVVLATWWVTSAGPVSNTLVDESGNTVQDSAYKNALDSAQKAADKMENPVSVSSKAIFVYDEISVPDDTRILDLSGKSLSGSLKAEIRHLTNLRELDISNNNFTGLPAEVGQLSRLEVLNLSNNPFTGLPNELGNLSNLQVLDLRGTSYSEQDLSLIKQSMPNTAKVFVD
ncbi:leucine-rich repeat domain-containing protein [Candidatus Kaiserbacteria bacterium]|nr:leucine-rich repeat domain-containing protein [Candidatus Kaiserbacteria bacterium]